MISIIKNVESDQSSDSSRVKYSSLLECISLLPFLFLLMANLELEVKLFLRLSYLSVNMAKFCFRLIYSACLSSQSLLMMALLAYFAYAIILFRLIISSLFFLASSLRAKFYVRIFSICVWVCERTDCMCFYSSKSRLYYLLCAQHYRYSSSLLSFVSTRSFSLFYSQLRKESIVSSQWMISNLRSLFLSNSMESQCSFSCIVMRVSSWNSRIFKVRELLWKRDFSLKDSFRLRSLAFSCYIQTIFCYNSYLFLLLSTNFQKSSASFFLVSAALSLSSLLFTSLDSNNSRIASKNSFMTPASLHPSDMADSCKYLFKLAIQALHFSHSEALDLQDLSSSSRLRMRLRKFAFSWIIFQFCSILLQFWPKENSFSLLSRSGSKRSFMRGMILLSAGIAMSVRSPRRKLLDRLRFSSAYITIRADSSIILYC